MKVPYLPDPYLPPGCTDADPYFETRSRLKPDHREVTAPKTVMVYCPECMRHYEAPATKDYWKARVELCPEHLQERL